MIFEKWLPVGFDLPDGSKIKSLLSAKGNWQLFTTSGPNKLLVAENKLAKKWIELGLIEDSVLWKISIGKKQFLGLSSHEKYALGPIDRCMNVKTKADGLAFAIALKNSRSLVAEGSFGDALYVERYSKLLPVWSLEPYIEDELVLGTWLTGGVAISTQSFRRLHSLTGWMPKGDLVEIVSAAGFTTPAELSGPTSTQLSKIGSRSKTVLTNKAAEPDELVTSRATDVDGVFQLPGRPHIEEFFNEHVIDIIFNEEKYSRLGISFPSAIILHGPPGCGKTFAVDKLVEFIDWPSYSINSNSVGSLYIHETSKKISGIFDLAIDNSPSVIVIDEMESFLSDRRANVASGQHHVEEVAEFLRRIPEAINNKVLIIAMTNMIDVIDPAILRRGRFDHIIEVGMPTREEVESLLNSLLSKIPTAKDISLDTYLELLTGKALSDSAFFIREASRLAAKNGKHQLDQESLETAINSLPRKTEQESRRIGFV